MNPTRQILLLCACWFALVTSVCSQSPDAWPSVANEDLALKDNPANPGSSAMILERQVSTDDETRVQREFLRIKVFTEAGRSNADVEIPYVMKSTSVENIRARTVQPDGRVVPFTGVVFDRVVVKYKRFAYDAKAFTLPSVQTGSIIEYSYEVHWKERLPNYVRNPIGYVVTDGFTVPSTTWTIQKNLFTRHAVFVLRPVKNGTIAYAKVRLQDIYPSRQPGGTIRMEIDNIPAIEDEDRMPPRSMLTGRVHFYYQIGSTSSYWTTISSAEAKANQKFLERNQFLERAANDVAPTTDPPETRLRKLYVYVQKVRNLSNETEKTEKETKREHLGENKSAEDILTHNYSYGDEIDYLFTALARSAGFDAYIVQVADRSSGVFEPQVLDPSQLNAVVVQVHLNGKDLYFDPANRMCPYGVIPWYKSDTLGVRWDKTNGNIVRVLSQASETGGTERTASLKLDADGRLEGTVEIAFTGQEALEQRTSALDEDDEGRRRLLEDELKKLVPEGSTIDLDEVTGWLNPEQPLRLKCHLHSPRFAVLTPKRMLFPLSVFQANSKNPFPQVYRTQPVYFRYRHHASDKIEISLPAGYKLEALPAVAKGETEFAKFHVERSTGATAVWLERQTEMIGYYVAVESYGSLRSYFQNLRQSDAQNVVLVKEGSKDAQ